MALGESSPVLMIKVGCVVDYINMPIVIGLEMVVGAPVGFKCM
jgi:hypothetical protein